jgi:hypothetical protein
MQIKESYVNQTKGYRFGERSWYRPWTDDRHRLFRSLQHEFGRCVSKIYVDGPPTRSIGWVFQKRMEYEDYRPGSRGDRYYTRAVWVEVRDDVVASEETMLWSI